VLWIGGVGVVTWPAFDPAKLAATKDAPYTGYLTQMRSWRAARSPDAGRRQKGPFCRSRRQPSCWRSERRWSGRSRAFGEIAVTARVFALIAMVVCLSMTAQAADTVLTLACQGTTTTRIGEGPPEQEPISIGVIVNFTDRTVVAGFMPRSGSFGEIKIGDGVAARGARAAAGNAGCRFSRRVIGAMEIPNIP
jgi:hypothetical protein